MIDFFNERFITMMPARNGKQIYREIARRLNAVERYKSNQAGRFIMLRFDDDNADVCCAYYTNVDDFTKPPLQSHTPFREILNTRGGFWNFMKYPFSMKFNYIIQIIDSNELRGSANANSSLYNDEVNSAGDAQRNGLSTFAEPYEWNAHPAAWLPPDPALVTGPSHSVPFYPQQPLSSSCHYEQGQGGMIGERVSPSDCAWTRCTSSTSDTVSAVTEARNVRMESIEKCAFARRHIRSIFVGREDNEVGGEIFAHAEEYEVHAKTGQRRETREIEDAETLSGVFDKCSINTFGESTRRM
ncbi:unnamed protein product [Toxocara canis]|uniref:YTH domain-containing protein n=1 Tax=Toxocara canis TaxID=6265 RepID=A0A183TZN8_TOXCA|nr:unnamed protein product [Toxocara canis]